MDAALGSRYRVGVITRLEIENFKAIRNVAIDLTPLTVFVGPNDSGKSTILQALALLGRCTRARSLKGEADSVFTVDPASLFGDRERPMRFSVETRTVGARIAYEIVFRFSDGGVSISREVVKSDDRVMLDVTEGRAAAPAGQQASRVEPALRDVHDEEGSTVFRDLRADLRSFYATFEPPEMVEPSEADAELASNGAGLAGTLDRLLTSPERDTVVTAFEQSLRRQSRNVHSIATRPAPVTAGGRASKGKELLFTLRDRKTTVPAREASTGLVLAAGYLALLYGTPHRRFLIEEPENGVHPIAILTIVDVLRELVQKGAQVVAVTHSPILLSYMEPGDVQVVTRDAEHGVMVTPISRSRFFNEMSQKMDLGELWYAAGEGPIVSTAS